MTIQVYKLFNKQKINTIDDGARLFNLLSSNLETNPTDMKLILDMKDIISFGDISFKTLITRMKLNLEGDIEIKLINQNPLINKAFKNSL